MKAVLSRTKEDFSMEKNISKLICKQLEIEYIDFSIVENFVKLLDLIFKYKKYFTLQIHKKVKNFQEDVLRIFLEELESIKTEKPLEIKEFARIVKNENWIRATKENMHLNIRERTYLRMANKILRNIDTAYTFMKVVCDTVSIGELSTIESMFINAAEQKQLSGN